MKMDNLSYLATLMLLGFGVVFKILTPVTIILKYAVPAYTFLLILMTWRGYAYASFENFGQASPFWGSVLFLISDTILSLRMFTENFVPKEMLGIHQFLVLATYYPAQLGIASSVFNNRFSNKMK